MPEPDIIETLSANLTRTTIIQAVEITRQGRPDAQGKPGWRISLPLVREVSLPDGTTAPQPAEPVAFDLVDLLHDASVQQLYPLLRDVTIRIARGDLKPLPTPSE